MTSQFQSESIISSDCTLSDAVSFSDTKPTRTCVRPEASQTEGDRAKPDPIRAKQAANPAGNGRDNDKSYQWDDNQNRFESAGVRFQSKIFANVKVQIAEKQVDVEDLAERRRLQDLQNGISRQDAIVVSQYSSAPQLEEIQLESVEGPDWSQMAAFQSVAIADSGTLTSGPGIAAPNDNTRANVNGVAHHESESDQCVVPPESVPTLVSDCNDLSEKLRKRPIQPAWEVNDFRWPGMVSQLCRDHHSAFVQLIQSLNLKSEGQAARLGIVNTQKGQGASTLAICLANILATTAGNTLLVDVDFDAPSLEKSANISIESGWQKVTDSTTPLDEFLVRSIDSNLTIMPIHASESNPQAKLDLLGSLAKCSAILDKNFEFIVYDFGHYSNSLAGQEMPLAMDAMVVVSDQAAVSEGSDAAVAFGELNQAGVASVVVAENFRKSNSRAA